MMINSNVTSYITARAATQGEEAPETPDARLLSVLARQGSLLLPDIPAALGMTAGQALEVVERLRERGLAVLMEREGVRYLLGKSPPG